MLHLINQFSYARHSKVKYFFYAQIIGTLKSLHDFVSLKYYLYISSLLVWKMKRIFESNMYNTFVR
jgi:hypothetical protein